MAKVEYEVVNMVASANLGREVDLYGVAMEVDNVEYEPEQFPGAILKLKKPTASLLLFKNGKMICTGVKNEKQVEEAINKAYELVKEYMTDSPKK